MTQLSHNHHKNLPLLSNCWWFQQGLRNVLQTLEFYHGLNYICRSKVEIIPQQQKKKHSSSSVNACLHMVYLENCPWLPVLHAVCMLKVPKGTVSSQERKCVRLKLKINRVEEGLQIMCHSWSEMVEAKIWKSTTQSHFSSIAQMVQLLHLFD